MRDDIIFIHIPKTGGTTINTALMDSYWQTKPDFNYRHIDAKSMISNSGDIFQPRNFEKFKSHKIFMMLRDPVDRVISEYHFLKDRTGFIELFDRKPRNLEEYAQHPQTHNGVVNFLKGNRIYSKVPVQGTDLDDILDAIDEVPIQLGIFEEFEKSMEHFAKVLDIKWKRKLEAKRITFRRPKVEEVSEETKALIRKHNELDLELYEYGLQKFNSVKVNYSGNSLKFEKDKYNHVIPYVYSWCFFEFCVEHKKYLRKNLDFFKALTFQLLDKEKIRDGKRFTEIWNATYLNALEQHFPNSDFLKAIKSATKSDLTPLEQLEAYGSAIDGFFEQDPKQVIPYYKPMKFEESIVVKPKGGKGIFRKLFS